MKLNVNGEQVEIPNTVEKVSDLLEHLGINEKVAIVELNANILQKADHAATKLTNGDRVEIVHFVGGG
ncbi:sulfur carrier protein ThiS [Ammoniphilus resinae]|uniref:Sulfur carrier protein n=1 Tax=Ammoniphilus resinae TaxID=861532 RepID=A0ABS4GRU0_9BACL|nr:sulfur carrier protein ThiS [Ammoniphilus resinae]MBP1932737.1 sulfur carrier protein [Ammoniphilus resinae]